MAHYTHLLKSYAGDPGKRLVFCSKCGKEEDEGLNDPCEETFIKNAVKQVDKDKEQK